MAVRAVPQTLSTLHYPWLPGAGPNRGAVPVAGAGAYDAEGLLAVIGSVGSGLTEAQTDQRSGRLAVAKRYLSAGHVSRRSTLGPGILPQPLALIAGLTVGASPFPVHEKTSCLSLDTSERPFRWRQNADFPGTCRSLSCAWSSCSAVARNPTAPAGEWRAAHGLAVPRHMGEACSRDGRPSRPRSPPLSAGPTIRLLRVPQPSSPGPVRQRPHQQGIGGIDPARSESSSVNFAHCQIRHRMLPRFWRSPRFLGNQPPG